MSIYFAPGEGGSTSAANRYTFAVIAPVDPVHGDQWTDSRTGRTYTFLDDGDSHQWVENGPVRGGLPGLSAYEVAVAAGFVGTEEEWLASLVGPDGADGASAYEVAVSQGFTGTEAEWLASLVGPEGPQGIEGPMGSQGIGIRYVGTVDTEAELPASATQGDLYVVSTPEPSHGFVWDDTTASWVDSGPVQGPQGVQGVQGIQGIPGPPGPTAVSGDEGNGLTIGSDGLLFSESVDLSLYLPLAGGTMTGPISLPTGIRALDWGSAWLGSDGTNVSLVSEDNYVTVRPDEVVVGSPVTLPADPEQPLQAASKQYVDAMFAGGGYVLPAATATVLGGVMVGSGLAITPEGTLSVLASVMAGYLPLAGGTMTGTINVPDSVNAIRTASGFNLIGNNAAFALRMNTTNLMAWGINTIDAYRPIGLPADPAQPLHAATKQYVDAKTAGGSYVLPTATATVLGGVKVGSGLAITPEGTLSVLASVMAGYLPLAGGTMTGTINVPATKDILLSTNGFSLYDNNVTFLVRKNGASIIGFGAELITSVVPIKLPADPTQALEAATKQYVDNKAPRIATTTVLGAIRVGAGLAITPEGVLSSAVAGNYLLKAGDQMTGPLRLATMTAPSTYNGTDWYQWHNGTIGLYFHSPTGKNLILRNDGRITLGAAPVDALDAVTRAYLDTALANISGYLPTTGGTMTGGITLPTTVQSFTWGTTTYNLFGASGGVAVRHGNNNIVNFTSTAANFVQQIIASATAGIVFGASNSAGFKRGSVAAKIAATGMVELPDTAPTAADAVRKDYVDARVVMTAEGAAAPATTGLSAGTLWVEYA